INGREAIREMFISEFAAAKMHCLPEHIFEEGEWAILEWRDPLGLRGCGFFRVVNDQIVFQRGYWDRLAFLR
ncbi:MAG TPA: steroid delta-isomerase, partial [Verrucomicrobiales bacterium]|nr:steroid delta-isomerase [Verrucomicrobiales bacterium]